MPKPSPFSFYRKGARVNASLVTSVSLCLSLAGCAADAEPEDAGSAAGSQKDASIRTRDAGKRDGGEGDDDTTADGPEDDDDDQAEPTQPSKDAGKPTVIDAGAAKDAGTTTRKDASTPVTPAGDGGGSVSGLSAADLDMLRQVCVDEINMYRATLMLAPLTRPTAQHENCSDEGAKVDGDSKQAHGWAKAGYKCTGSTRGFPGFFAQNTCPGWPASSVSAIATSLQGCLKQMWAEGEPPEGEEKCKADFSNGQTACFLAHGHYLNMKGSFKSVSCGFYNMGKSTYWMNQDFL